MPRRFVLNSAKYVLLTYAQCPEDWDPLRILEMCNLHNAECLIARERHADGGLHYHVFVEFEKPFSTRRTEAFDVAGRHPNIALVGKTPRVAWDYVCKEGDIVGGGAEAPLPDCEIPAPTKRGTDSDWRFILDAEDEHDFFLRIRERSPKSLACNYPSLRKYADWAFKRAPVEFTPPQGVHFNLENLPDLDSWVGGSLLSTPEQPRINR